MVDDHQTPADPELYIKLRIHPQIEFYTNRIPKYSWHDHILRISILLLGATAAIFARYDELVFVVIVTAASSAITSWAEFSEDTRKIERYTSSVHELEKILSWWGSLGQVQVTAQTERK